MRPVSSLSISLVATALFAVEGAIAAMPGEGAGEINDTVLGLLQSMPSGGGYSISRGATAALGSAIAHVPGALVLRPNTAIPSYCSGATYIVFLRLVDRLGRAGLPIDDETRSALLVRGQRDGEGVWGRWNANGPGTARLFHELDLGSNFTDYARARPGDFMKVFWTSEVGRAERGHSVVYIGREMVGGTEHVRFWSSNKPAGYGEKTVPRSKIARAIFSRLDRPQNLARVRGLPRQDPYLASLLTVRSSFAEACAKSGCK